MKAENLRKIVELRHELHAHPELSMHESWTKRRLMDFIAENTTLSVVDCGAWFYAARYREGSRAVAFRADMDALPIPESIKLPWGSKIPGVSHKCGHDGHSAALCGAALELEGADCPRSLYFIFQHAEETGQGGAVAAAMLKERGVTEVYACHNWSGYPQGCIMLRRGLCECASRGLTVRMTGRRSHASEPENGNNPVFALAELALEVRRLLAAPHQGMILATIVNLSVGTRDFGVSPGEGEISMTLRADREAEMDALEAKIRGRAMELAMAAGLEVGFDTADAFPETVSDGECVDRVEAAAKRLGFPVVPLDAPWRGSEDFGHYTKQCPGAIFYVGNGEDWPAIHTLEYDYNDKVLETAADLFCGIYRGE